jgi:hypothetical protein
MHVQGSETPHTYRDSADLLSLRVAREYVEDADPLIIELVESVVEAMDE